jgi:hypothetical protein
VRAGNESGQSSESPDPAGLERDVEQLLVDRACEGISIATAVSAISERDIKRLFH